MVSSEALFICLNQTEQVFRTIYYSVESINVRSNIQRLQVNINTNEIE